MTNFQQTRPDLMVGKKILYVHGFASSGQSGTVKSLRELLPQATVICPDLPIHPAEALDLLRQTCKAEQPDLIIGTSMGGMFAEQLHGYDRILVNPAFHMADTFMQNHTLGRQQWHNPRQDGEKEFWVTKDLVAEYREATQHCFEEVTEDDRRFRVYGLFGKNDPLVHTRDTFLQHYINGIWFEGEHQLNNHIIIHSLMPVIQWIDDRQEGRERPVLYIDMDNCLVDYNRGLRQLTPEEASAYEGHPWDVPGFFGRLEPMPSAIKAFEWLSQRYDTYILSSAPSSNPTAWSDKLLWCQRWLGVGAWRRLIISSVKHLSYGDYLIDDREVNGAKDFMGTFLHFGEDPFKTWDDTMEYFERLGGQ